MSEPEIMVKLFPEWSPTKRAACLYALRCVAHRLRQFGFEDQVNLYSPRELAVLATLLPQFGMHNFLAEARRRAEAAGDDELRDLLTVPDTDQIPAEVA